MKLIAINGGPRKEWNTATLLKHAMDGAKSKGADTELIHLYDLNFKGCTSCFACKTKGGKSFGKCAMQDGLTPVLEKIAQADALVVGSPIYLGSTTGETRSFLERLIFQYLQYTNPPSTTAPRKIRTAFIYTMNVTQEQMDIMKYQYHFDLVSGGMQRNFGSHEALYSFDTMQFEDYEKFVAPRFDAEAKRKRHEEVFPQDCMAAFELGARL